MPGEPSCLGRVDLARAEVGTQEQQGKAVPGRDTGKTQLLELGQRPQPGRELSGEVKPEQMILWGVGAPLCRPGGALGGS